MKLKPKVAVVVMLLPVCTLILLLYWTHRYLQIHHVLEPTTEPLDKEFEQIIVKSTNSAPSRGVYSGLSINSLCSNLYQWSDSPISEPIAVCGSRIRPIHSVKCYKSSISFPPLLPPSTKSMLGINRTSSVIDVMCTLENLAVTQARGQHYISKYLRPSISNELAPSLLTYGQSSQCPVPTLAKLMLSTKSGDYMRTFVQETLNSERMNPSICKSWINQTAYFFVGSEPHNVYFIFLTYYNIHHTLRRSTEENNKLIIRFSGDPNSKFEDFETKLFPELASPLRLNGTEVVCFRKVVIVPRCYNSLPFQCVEQKDLQKVCLKCANYILERAKNSRERNSFQEFRTMVLNACGIELRESNSRPKKVLFVRRKPYVRSRYDNPGMFQRVLSNEGELLSTIPDSFPPSQMSFSATYMEDFDICTQIRMANSADILIGVHGAGLVHLWWMKEDGWVLELAPKKKDNRRTYETLSALLGRNYRSISCLDGGARNHFVTADVKDVVETLSMVLQPNHVSR